MKNSHNALTDYLGVICAFCTPCVHVLLGILLFFCVTGCGYRFQGCSELTKNYKSICVPYIEGDINGLLTSLLIKDLMARGQLVYSSCASDLILKVSILPVEERTIGFTEAKRPKGQNRRFIVSNEARLFLKGQFLLIDRKTAMPLLGPIEVAAHLDYDYESDLGKFDSNAFSLGQLEMQNLAQDAALRPLYSLLAEKIVNYIYNY